MEDNKASVPTAHRQGPTDQDIVEAYHYMLSRWLVLRQERRDLDEGFRWNEIIHRDPGGVSWANPNLDVAYSEAWIAIDEDSATLLELPEIAGRYYTFQLLNGWGEVTLNINERNFPDHPWGLFALCLQGSSPQLPADALRIDLPNRKSRLLMRVELADDPQTAIALQRSTTLTATGSPKVDPPVDIAFERFPGVEAFDTTDEVLASERDINPGVEGLQAKARAVAALAASDQRGHVAQVIEAQAIPQFMKAIAAMGQEGNGWVRPRMTGAYGDDYQMRSLANFTGIWANNTKEVIYFARRDLDGGAAFTITFPVDALPDRQVRYFWSVIAVDNVEYRVIPNDLDRFLLNKASGLEPNPDGSLTLYLASRRPEGAPEPNWLPTPAGEKYNLTFRFYGPSEDVASGRYFPPPVVPLS